MSISDILSLLGGVALFLFGMTMMGEGLKKVAGSSLEIILYRLSSTPLKGLLLGAGVTAVIQSSSATSVMVVGFVNSNIMKLRQAISIILGSIIGTSITGWIISLSSIEGNGWVSIFSTETLSAIVAVAGIILRMFCKEQKKRHVGEILLGFAVLMYGMQAMSGAVGPLKNDPAFVSILTAFSNPLLGILAGAAFTAVLQSASAGVGILQALSATGIITFAEAFPIILGISIGAAVPVLMSAIGAKANGRRAAYAYLIISLLGSAICGILFYAADAAADFAIKNMIMDTFSIALVNTLFRAVTGLLLLPILKLIEDVVTRMVRESAEEKAAAEILDRLDDRFLSHPAMAVEQSRLTTNDMAEAAKSNLLDSLNLIFNYSDEGFSRIEQDEDFIDRFEDKIGTYLLKLNTHELSKMQNEQVTEYLHTISDFERISDHAMNLAEAAQEIHEKKITFSDEAVAELQTLFSAVKEILEISVSAFVSGKQDNLFRVEPLEEWIDVMCDEMKLKHAERMQTGICSMTQGFVFNDILGNMERVSDHCSNIAIAIVELRQDNLNAHGYAADLKELHNRNFDEYYEEYSVKYKI